LLEATYGHAKSSMLKNLRQIPAYSNIRGLCPIYEDDEQCVSKNERVRTL